MKQVDQALNIDAVIKDLKYLNIDAGGTAKLAKTFDTSPTYLRKIFRKERPPTDEMIKAVGYKLAYIKGENSHQE